MLVQEDLLNDEGSHSLRKLGAALHDAQAQRNDLGLEQEADHIGVVHFHQGANHAERGESKVFEWPSLAHSV